MLIEWHNYMLLSKLFFLAFSRWILSCRVYLVSFMQATDLIKMQSRSVSGMHEEWGQTFAELLHGSHVRFAGRSYKSWVMCINRTMLKITGKCFIIVWKYCIFFFNGDLKWQEQSEISKLIWLLKCNFAVSLR